MPVAIHNHHEHSEHGVYFGTHSHPTHELVWKDRGAGVVVGDGERWTTTPGLGLWIPAGMPHSGWTMASSTSYSTHFNVGSLKTLSTRPIAVAVTPLLRLLLLRLSEPDLPSDSRAVAEAMVFDVIRPAERQLRVCVPTDMTLRPIIDAVLADPSTQTTLDVWARRLDVSSRTLHRGFIEHTGCGFAEWVRGARIQHAIPLLLEGATLDELCEPCGYHTATSFSVAFRKVTGLTPGQFRSRHITNDHGDASAASEMD
ncbi:AraC family transcriptional regulator [Gordonia sp. (in: high G+C Gram-positive bacteria)]|uniref:AraC family transcriptional regulator n=1 Tax=Gordonia sp. (in: high G+C Gram-positive bacteria) TaxID=84139 RepID=UPI003F99BC65